MNAGTTSFKPSAVPLDPAYGVVALATIAVFAVAAFSPQLFNDGDTYWHIKAGEWMLDHRAILRSDPFSYTMQGASWDTQEWFAEIIMALIFRALGWSGVAVLFASAAAAATYLFAFELSRWLRPLTMFVTLVLALGCVGGGMLARPHLLTLPLLVIWTAELLQARADSRAPRWPFLLVMVLWANLHGSFILGLALIGPFALEAVVEAGTERRKTVLAWGAFTVGAILAAMATPRGFEGLLFPLKLMSMTQLSFIREWQSTNFTTVTPLELGLVAALYVFLSRGVRISFFRVLLLLVMLHMALQHDRQVTVLALCGTLIWAKPLAEAFAEGTPVVDRTNISTMLPALAATILLVCALATVRFAIPLRRGDDVMSPITALAHVPSDIKRQPVFNDYPFGGYLIYADIKPFIDSRADLYGDAFLLRYREMVVPDPALLAETLRQYHVAWALLQPANGVNRYFETAPDWRRLYGDRFAIVYVRRSAQP